MVNKIEAPTPLETGEIPYTQFLSLENIQDCYPLVIEETWRISEIAKERGLIKNSFGRACLWFCLAQAKILRPILREPSLLLNSSLIQETGGPEYNPTRQIDTIGGDLIIEISRHQDFLFNYPLDIFIEERGWQRLNQENEGSPLIIIVDPLDGTEAIKDGFRDQAIGIGIFTEEGAFLAGGICSLVDNEMLLIEENNIRVLSFDERGNRLLEVSKPEISKRELDKARIATLTRRMGEEMLATPLFAGRFFPDLPTFGGYGVLSMIRGQIEVMLDPFKGQPFYEACLWGVLAEKAGMVVTDLEGEKIDFPSVLKNARGGKGERVKIIISSCKELHSQVLERLKLGVQEGVLQ